MCSILFSLAFVQEASVPLGEERPGVFSLGKTVNGRQGSACLFNGATTIADFHSGEVAAHEMNRYLSM
eukprot:2295659-Amphidinium_carterae.1